jgi:hypothetical protein
LDRRGGSLWAWTLDSVTLVDWLETRHIRISIYLSDNCERKNDLNLQTFALNLVQSHGDTRLVRA